MKESNKERYRILVDFLGKTLGPDFEVVLQEVDTENPGIIAIANGSSVSGRHIGSPLTETALQMIMQHRYEKCDYLLNYPGELAGGKLVRSSTMFIKEDDRLTGLLCINFDDSKYHEIAKQLLCAVHPDDFVQKLVYSSGRMPQRKLQEGSTGAEHFQSSPAELIDGIFTQTQKYLAIPPDRLTVEERFEFLARLYDRGLFRLHGSIPYVMEKMKLSQASVYRILAQIKEERSSH